MKTYQYIILRYRHDAVTGEFANIGVVMLSEDRFLGARFCQKISRIKQFFANIQRTNFKQLMVYLQGKFDRISLEVADSIFPNELLTVCHKILPPDDSAYQWSEIRQGLASSPEQEIDYLYDRLVAQYEIRNSHKRRNDDDIWNSFSKPLREHQVAKYLVPKRLETEDYRWNFNHTFKNGCYHLYEPLAFDYEEPSQIAEKAIRWQGRGYALQTAEKHQFWFLVGDVEGESRKRAVDKALNLLNAIPAKVEIIREHEKEEFAKTLADLVSIHTKTES